MPTKKYKPISSSKTRKPTFTGKQIAMMLTIDDSGLDEDKATDLFGPRFRIALHPLSSYGLVGSSCFGGTKTVYHLTVEGMEDLEAIKEILAQRDEGA